MMKIFFLLGMSALISVKASSIPVASSSIPVASSATGIDENAKKK